MAEEFGAGRSHWGIVFLRFTGFSMKIFTRIKKVVEIEAWFGDRQKLVNFSVL